MSAVIAREVQGPATATRARRVHAMQPGRVERTPARAKRRHAKMAAPIARMTTLFRQIRNETERRIVFAHWWSRHPPRMRERPIKPRGQAEESHGHKNKPAGLCKPAGRIKSTPRNQGPAIRGRPERFATDNRRLRPRPCAWPNGNQAPAEHKRTQAPRPQADNRHPEGWRRRIITREAAGNNRAAAGNSRADSNSAGCLLRRCRQWRRRQGRR